MTDGADRTRASYDRVAGEYARRLHDELAHKPLERELLDRFAAGVAGWVCDLGCGPGQVAAYLHARGTAVLGVDLSRMMLAHARRLHPGLPFVQADLRTLPLAGNTLAGIVAFYSLIHIRSAEVPAVLRELRRVLRPGGSLLVSFHRGRETVHVAEWWGEPVCVDFVFFEPEEMVAELTAAGFVVAEVVERPPYPDIEVQTRRAYITARKPA